MGLKFRGQWRSYQKRILDSLDYHLMDKKLHIVAAPGAGKTTLGIEVISRIGRSSLILVPTNTIKNQWKNRICSSFLEADEYNLVSVDIRKPAFITISTYQALLAAFCSGAKSIEDKGLEDDVDDSEEEDLSDSIVASKRFSASKADEIVEVLKSANISLICFDEAHHLRKEWWKALTYLVENLKPEQTVALTATPPYDVGYDEWCRYEELCGPIDEVISIPELVKNGDLCPHQDFVYFSLLRDNEDEFVKKYFQNVSTFLEKLLSDNELHSYLSSMDFLQNSIEESCIEKIFDAPEFYVSIVSLLSTKGYVVPNSFLKLFDAKKCEIPKFKLNQAKIFLDGFLYSKKDEFSAIDAKREEYLILAKKLGLIQNKKLVLDDSKKIQKQIANSLGKIDSIVQIVNIEYSQLKDNLRMVILADYIKANDTDNSHLGVVPIWRTLKTEYKDLPIGVLCGSLILLPANAKDVFNKLLEEANLEKDCVTVSNYNEDESFIKITPKDSAKNYIVSLITNLFNRGVINVLVGTQALLGEGWDAPSINSLILSSTVSSYMLSNQMRGRAIRIDKNNPNKVSNIWHLASVKVPTKRDLMNDVIFASVITSDDMDNSSYFFDLNQLQKRFEGFEAPSYFENHEIVNGFRRVFSDTNYAQIPMLGERLFLRLNQLTVNLAKNREQTKQWWNSALNLGYNRSRIEGGLSVGIDAPRLTAKSLCYKGYRQIVCSILAVIIVYLPFGLYSQNFFIIKLFLAAIIIALIYVGYNFLRTGTVESVMKQIAIVHLETLSALGYIKTSLKKVGIQVVKTDDYIFVECSNLPTEENNILINAMKEFLDPIKNPRYLLIKDDSFAGFIKQVDYFAIPSIIASNNKKAVTIFNGLWNKYIGTCQIVYTRNQEGRALLLKARKNAFSALKRTKSNKLSKWQ